MSERKPASADRMSDDEFVHLFLQATASESPDWYGEVFGNVAPSQAYAAARLLTTQKTRAADNITLLLEKYLATGVPLNHRLNDSGLSHLGFLSGYRRLRRG